MKWKVSDKLTALGIIFSALTSTFAIFLSIYLWRAERSRETLTENPRLVINFVKHNDDKFYGIVFENAGKSYATIHHVMLITGDGNGRLAVDSGWARLFADLGISQRNKINVTSFQDGAVVPAGGRIRVVGLMLDNATDEMRSVIDRFESELIFGICYSSIFGEYFSTGSPGYDWKKMNICSKDKWGSESSIK